MQHISKTKKMILSALMITLSIVLSRFLSIKTPFLAISFSFVPTMLSAIWLGPKYTCLIAGIADLIGAIVFPFGEFFIGFTVSSILAGLIYGLILYKKEGELSKKSLLIRLIISTLAVTLVINTGLNTLWLVIMYDKAFIALLMARVVKELIMVPIQVITMFLLVQATRKDYKKIFNIRLGSYMRIEEYLKEFAVVTRKPTLDAMKYFMNEFGNPDRKTKFIHIAGTNGKGSVCEMINNILVNAGYKVRKVHLSSPYKL